MKNVYFSLEQEKSKLTQPFLAASLFHLLLTAMLLGLGAPTAGASNGDLNHIGSEPARSEVESTAPSGGGLDLASANGKGMPSLRTLGAGGTGCPSCTPATPCTGPYTGSITISTQTALNAFTGPGGCRYTTITGSLTLDGNGNSATGTDAPGGDPITDLCNLQYLTSVGGSLTIRDFNVVGSNPTNLDALCNLTTVGGNLNIGSTNANDNNSSFTDISLPNLLSVGSACPGTGSLLVTNNPNVMSISLPALTSVGSNATVQNNGTGVATIDLGALTCVGGNLSLNNNVSNAIAATVNLGSLMNVHGSLTLTRTVSNLTLGGVDVGNNLTISQNSALITLSLGGVDVGNNLTISQNSMLTTLSATGLEVSGTLSITSNTALTTINLPTAFSGPTAGVSITGNTSLSSITLGVSDVTGNVTIQGNGTGVSTINLSSLGSVGGSLSMNNTAANAISANINLSSLTTVGDSIRLTRAIGTLNATSLNSVGSNLSITNNPAFTSFDGSFSSLTSVGVDLTIQNNTNLSTCCRVLCEITVGGTKKISGNAPGCSSMANITATCTPPACPTNQTRNTDAGVCTYTANSNEFDVDCSAASISYALTGATTGTHTDLDGVAFNLGTTTVTATVTSSGTPVTTATCTYTITINDNQAPSISCPSTQTLTLDDDCEASLPDYTDDATAEDNCDTPTVTQDPAIGTPYTGPQTVTVTLTATDNSGNSATCTFTVNVVDNTPPTIACPSTQTLTLDDNCEASLPDYTDDATAEDNCDTPTVTQDPAIGTPYTGPQTVTVTLTATDNSGNSATCTFTVDVVDNTPPTIITCPGTQTLTLDDDCEASLPDYTDDATAEDNCDTPTVTQDPAIGTPHTGPQTVTVTLTATDDSGNSATCTFTVNVVDNTPPTIACPSTQTLTLDDNCEASLPDYTDDATAEDNCDTPTVTQDPAIGTPYTGPQTVTVTLTATDNSGNSATCTFTVDVVDNTPPTIITCPGTQTLTLDDNCEASLPDYTDDATAEDNCDTPTVTQDLAIGTPYTGPQTVTVTLTATDDSGNSATCTFTVNVVDNTPPTIITCPGTQTLTLDDDCEASLPDYTDDATAEDNCDTPTVTQDPAIGTPYTGPQTVTVTLTATDNSGNSATCTFTVNVVDNTPPTIACPSTQTLTLDDNCEASLPDYTDDATAEDNCDTPTVTQDPAIGTPYTGPQTVTVTLTATDNSGNSATCTFTVNVVDNTPPTIACPSTQTLTLDDNCEASLPDYTDDATAEDNCDTPTVTQDLAIGTPYTGPQTVTVTLTATDNSGNSATCTFTVDVVDNTPPTIITCPGTQTLTLDDNCEASLPDYTDDATAEDNCDTPTVTQDPAIGTPYTGPQTVTVTLTATDNSGNSATCTFTVDVVDNTPPTIACPSTQTLTLDDNCEASLPDYTDDATAEDNCDTPTVTQDPAIGTPYTGPQTVTVTLTATDNSGNSATCTFTVDVVDNTPPTIACPSTQTLTLDDNCEASLPDYTDDATAEDNCDTPTVTQDLAIGTPYTGPQTVTVTLTATDDSGNSATCTFTVDVVDNTPPTIITCPGTQTLTLDDDCEASLPDYTDDATAEDNCDTPTVTQDPAIGTPYTGPQTVTVTLTATDNSGNSATCTFTVDVVDNTPPTIACPSTQTLTLDDNCEASLPDYTDDATAEDNCDTPTVTQDLAIGTPYTGPQTVTVTLTATDNSGNSATCTFTVDVVDNTPPTIITCPGTQTLTLDDNCEASLPDYTDDATAEDNCDTPTVTQDLAIGTPYTGPQTVTVTLTATDNSGNSATCTFTVDVVDNTPPTIITCPGTQTLTLDDDCEASLPDYTDDATAEDNCDTPTVTQDPAIGTPYTGPQTVTVTLTATDNSGNSATCTFTVDVVDNTPPTIACPSTQTLTLDDNCEASLPDYTDDATAEDNCDTPTVTQDPAIGTPYTGPQTVTVTLTATDNSGNSATCTFTVDVVDNTPPTIACPSTQTLTLDDNCEASLPDYTDDATAEDNCDTPTVTQDLAIGTPYTGPQTVTVTLTATDNSGNSATCTFTVDVVDNTPPTIITCPGTQTLTLDDDCEASLPDYTDDATAEDNCDTPTVTQDPAIGTPYTGPQTVTVTLTATDNSGNSATCTFTVDVVDNTPPTIACPSTQTLTLDDNCEASLPDYTDDATAEDNCDTPTVTQDLAIGTPYTGPQTVTVTLTATDNSGNSATCTFTVDVVDNTPPTIITCPGTQTLTLDDNCEASLPDYTDDATAEDNCDTPTVTQDPAIGTPYTGPQTVTVTLTATDNSGNSATCTFTVNVVDNTPPTIITCPGTQTLTLDDDCEASLPDYTDDATAEDNCDTPTVTQDPAIGTPYTGPQTVTVTLTATDNSGNSATCTFTVDVVDNTPPTIACPSTQTLTLDDNCEASLPDYTDDATAEDNCDTPTVTQDLAIGTPYTGPQTVTVTLTATDNSGNSATCTFTVNVVDNTPPTIACPSTQTLTLDDNCEASLPDYTDDATAEDNCDTPTVTQDLAIGTPYTGPQTVTVTLTATDNSGNSATCTFTVDVVDNTPPTIITCPGTQTLTLDDNCEASLPDYTDDATAEDNCDTPTVTQDPAIGTPYTGPQTVTVTLTATDNSGNSATCTFTVDVVDNTPPTIACPSTQTLTLDDNCEASLPDYTDDATAEDNCDTPTVTQDPAIGTPYTGPQTVTVTLTATDNSGNSATCTFTVDVVDNTPPTIACPSTQTLTLDDNCEASLPDYTDDATAEDNCDTPTVTQDPAIGTPYTGPQTVTVTLTATDNSGNSATCTFTVDVVDNTPPTIITCPGTQTLTLDDDCEASLPDYTDDATAEDNCDTPTVTQDPAIGTPYTGPQTVTVTLTATDNSGNSATCTFTVDVVDNTPPTIACPSTQTLTLDDNCEASLPDYTDDATAEDNCDTPTVTQDPAIGTPYTGPQTVTVTLTATDNSGNSATCTFTVDVVDNTPPTIACPSTQTLTLDDNCEASLPDYTDDATAEDNCDTPTVTQDLAIGTPYTGPQTVTVTLTATDNSGNSATCTFTVDVVDNTPPTIITCPGTQTLTLDDDCEASLPDYTDDATAEDNCDTPTVTQDLAIGTPYTGPQTVTVTLTATDNSGNSATCTFTVDVVDNTPPTIACPSTQTLTLDDNCEASLPDYTDDATAEDNCDTPTVTQDPAIGTPYTGPQTVTVTLTATDNSGNSATCTFTVDVVDNTPPTIACPSTQTLTLDDNCEASLPDYTDDATAEDNCDTPTVTQDLAIGTPYTGPQTVTVTLTATDNSGNSATCTFTVDVVDNTPPTIITCPGTQTLTLDDDCEASLPDYTDDATAEDNCDTPTVTQDLAIGTPYTGPQTVTVTLTATDNSGNSATCTFTVDVVDNTPPTIACPSTQTLTLDDNCEASLPDYTSVASTSDNCSTSITVDQTPTPGTTVSGAGAMTVTLTADDGNGNTATCSFTVIKQDNTPPTVSSTDSPSDPDIDNYTCGSTHTYTTSPSSCVRFLTIAKPTWSDNCGVASTSHSAGSVPLSNFSTFVSGLFPAGTTTVVFSALDMSGNSASCTLTIAVNDVEAPTLTGCPTNTTTNNAPGLCSKDVSLAVPTASDNCAVTTTGYSTSGATTLAGSGFPISLTFNVGITTVTYTAADAAGNSTSCTFTVTVNDTEAPTISCPSSPQILSLDGLCSASLPDYTDDATAADNCDTPTVTQDPAVGTPYTGPQTVTVTLTATDNSGNSATCTFTVNVVDNTPPTITCPGTQTLVLDDNCEATLSDYTSLASSSDNCASPVPVNQVPTIGTMVSGAGTLTIVLVADDGNGNTASCSFVVNKQDNTPPTITCPGTQTLVLDDNCEASLPDYTDDATAADNCNTPTVTQDPAVGTPYTGPQTVTVTLTATDNSGNSATCTFTVDVVDNTPPTITCPSTQTLTLDDNCEASLPDYTNDATAEDNCDTPTVTQDLAIGTPYTGPQTVTVTLTATDNSGNSATCTFTVDVVDNTPPTITCPGTQTLTLDDDCEASLPDYTDDATAEDNCDTPTVTQDPAIGTPYTGPQTVTVTLTATDNSGNSATCTFTVDVVDNTPPTITCPGTQTLTLDDDCEASLPDYTDDATAEDNCDTPTVTQDPALGTPYTGPQTVTVTLTATDNSGNSATCTFTVDVVDNTPPTITCPGTQTLMLDDDCEASLPDYTSVASTSDNCSTSITVDQTPTPGTTVSGAGAMTVTLTADDGNGNTATCSFTVIKQDNTPPTITCPSTQTLILSPTCSATLPNYTGLATTSDNCATTVTVTQAPPAGTTVSGAGTVTVTLTADDGNGNTATCSFTVIKQDNTPPVFTFVPANVTVQCNSIPAPGTPTATDACGPVTITYNGSTTTPGSCPDAKTIVHTWTATDASGNTATATRVVTVIDTQKPNFTSVPANVTVQCDNIPPVGTPTATDNCDPVVAITYIGQTVTNGTCPNQYTLTRRWVAADNCGNTRSTSQVITVIDNTKPVFTSVPANVTIDCSGPVPPVGAATATDNCGSVTVQYLGQTTISGACPGKYQIKRTWKATDQCGNSTVATQTIQVDDTTPPVFTSVPANVTILCTEPLPPLGNPTATDNCSPYVHITFLGSTPTGSGCETPYTVTRTWMADDLCGNTSTATQVITVVPPPIGPEEVEERDAAKPQAPQWDDDRILTLQPNPTTDRVLVGLGSFAGERVIVAIHNEMGQLIYERTVEAVPDLMVPVSLRESGATPGLFTVSVRSSGRVVAKRLVLIE